jgi:ATPase subunit of ABC transporter with duplicated ATPase domains
MDGFIVVIVVDLILLAAFLASDQGFLRKFQRFHTRGLCASSVPGSDLERTARFERMDTELTYLQGDGADDANALRGFISSVKRCLGPQEVGTSYDFHNVSCTVGNGKTILAPQSGHIKKGSLLGVMGASGSGKSEYLPLLPHVKTAMVNSGKVPLSTF